MTDGAANGRLEPFFARASQKYRGPFPDDGRIAGLSQASPFEKRERMDLCRDVPLCGCYDSRRAALDTRPDLTQLAFDFHGPHLPDDVGRCDHALRHIKNTSIRSGSNAEDLQPSSGPEGRKRQVLQSVRRSEAKDRVAIAHLQTPRRFQLANNNAVTKIKDNQHPALPCARYTGQLEL